jgi:hypothetical protein
MSVIRFPIFSVAAAVSRSMLPAQRARRKTDRCPWPRPEGWPTYEPGRVNKMLNQGDKWQPLTGQRAALVGRRETVEVDGLRGGRPLGELDDREYHLFYLQLAAWRAALLVESAHESRRNAAILHAGQEEMSSFNRGHENSWHDYCVARDRWRAALEAHRAR